MSLRIALSRTQMNHGPQPVRIWIANVHSISQRKRAHETLSELRQWVDGYVAGATRKMGRIEAREFERTAKAILGEVGKQLKKMAHRASEHQPDKARLKTFAKRIETLLARLDRFIVRSFGRPPTQRPLPQIP